MRLSYNSHRLVCNLSVLPLFSIENFEVCTSILLYHAYTEITCCGSYKSCVTFKKQAHCLQVNKLFFSFLVPTPVMKNDVKTCSKTVPRMTCIAATCYIKKNSVQPFSVCRLARQPSDCTKQSSMQTNSIALCYKNRLFF